MEIDLYISKLTEKFKNNTDPEKAVQMSRYMKNLFDYYGIQATQRRELSKSFLKEEGIPVKSELFETLKKLWDLPQREYQYFGMELAAKFKKEPDISDIEMFKWMILHKSWWDTVDFIAANLVGNYFQIYGQQTNKIMENWLGSGNMWLQRTSLIFQLKNKASTNTDLLSRQINALNHSKEFFINKAIGWALREYSKTNPDWVRQFVSQTELSPLSKREALKRIKGAGDKE